MKSVDEGQHVGLEAQAGANDAQRAASSGGESGGLAVHTGSELADGGVRDPSAVFYVKAEEIGVDPLADSDEVGHKGDAQLTAEEADDVEERGEGEHILWFREGSGEHGLQDDVCDESYESEGLTDAHQKFRAEVVCRGPRAGVFGVEDGRGGHAHETSGHDQAGIEALQQQKGGNERHKEEWRSRPDHRRTNLIRFETVDGERLRDENNGGEQAEAKKDQRKTEDNGVPLAQEGQIDERVRAAETSNERDREEKHTREE